MNTELSILMENKMSDKYNALRSTTDWILNSPSEEFMSSFKTLKNDCSKMTAGAFIDCAIKKEKDDCEHDTSQLIQTNQ